MKPPHGWQKQHLSYWLKTTPETKQSILVCAAWFPHIVEFEFTDQTITENHFTDGLLFGISQTLADSRSSFHPPFIEEEHDVWPVLNRSQTVQCFEDVWLQHLCLQPSLLAISNRWSNIHTFTKRNVTSLFDLPPLNSLSPHALYAAIKSGIRLGH